MRKLARVIALFTVYSGIGFGGQWGAALVAQELGDRDGRAADPDLVVQAEPVVDVVVDVEPNVEVDVRVLTLQECGYGAVREATIPADGVARLALVTGSGALRVEGRYGLDEIAVTANACASSEEWLEELQLTVTRSNSGDVVLTTHYPDRSDWTGRDGTARLDLTVLVPLDLAVDIEDSSGEIEVSGTGDTEIDDSSGSIYAHGINGYLRVDDSSGSLRIEDVAGDVDIEDGSGEIEVRDVQGSVAVRDGSGEVDVSEVERDVIVESDGSGGIRVRNIGGDLLVGSDGSGSITYDDVAGSVEIPADKRRRRSGRR